MSNIQISEAVNAGEELIAEIEKIESNLYKAKLWGFVDMFSDKGLLTSVFKHSRLKNAQEGVDELRYHINMFNSELNDVKVNNSISSVTMSTELKLADWLLDGIIFDSVTLARIYKSSNELHELKKQVNEIIDGLRKMRSYKRIEC